MDPIVIGTRGSLLLGFLGHPMTLSEIQDYLKLALEQRLIPQIVAEARSLGGSAAAKGLKKVLEDGEQALGELLESDALLHELIELESLGMVERDDNGERIVWTRKHMPVWTGL